MYKLNVSQLGVLRELKSQSSRRLLSQKSIMREYRDII